MNSKSKSVVLDRFDYKGFEITENLNTKFNSTYYSIADLRNTYTNEDGEKKNPHCHAGNKHLAKQIVDCFCQIKYMGYSRAKPKIKDQALRLMNYEVKIG